MLEPYDWKLSRTVLRGEGGSNASDLPGKALASANMSNYIRYLFKTVRKFFGEAVVVTQEVEDIISSPIVKGTIINNSDCKILLDQRKYMNKFDEIQTLLGLTDKERAHAIEQKDKLERLLTALDMRADGEVALHVNFGLLEEEPEQLAFFRGAFLAGGSVTDPAKRYHLELATPHLKVSAEASVLLREIGFSAKETNRAGNSILYFKQSDTIEDFLTAIGAQVSAMGVMEAKVEKDLRNGVNRRVNCETANLSKAVDASFEQLAAIRRLEEASVLETLPQKLQETARLRRENPEATLSELAEMPNPPVSKSAINHRMRKLMELSKTL